MSEYTNNPYLTFIGEEKDFTLTATNKGWTGTLEYSTDKENWYVWDGSAIQSVGLLLYLRGEGNNRLYNVRLVLSERAGCYGNVNVLLDYENPFPESLSSIGSNFYNLFCGCTNLIAAPELPCMGLYDSCYNSMFSGTSITEPPELPATTLVYGCYYRMFYNCQQLKRAPELPATTLTPSCYYQMFYNCISLKQPPSKLPATEAATYCYYNMFQSCKSLSTLPKIYLTKLADYCMRGMFYNCSKLSVSTTKTGEYTIPWRFPTVGVVDTSTTSSTDWNNATFNAIGSSSITLSPDTTYYLKSPATEQQLYSRICLKGDTYANWTSSNPILKKNEVALYTDTSGFKVGDGTTRVASLPYFLSSNAATATKLQTARTISLGTAVTATATNFDGSANITVPVTGVKEAYLTWGGKDYAAGFGPLDAALIGDLSINRLAGLHESRWKFERSSDAGETWEEYTGPSGARIGTIINNTNTEATNANTTSSKSIDNWHRITIDVAGNIYCELRKIAIYLSTNGATGCKCKLEWGDYSDTTVWTTQKESTVSGWSGWNILQVSRTIGSSIYGNTRYIRLTFSQTGVDSSYASNVHVNRIRFYAQNCWNAPSYVGTLGTPYTYNENQDVTFKSTVSVPNGNINTGGQVYATGNIQGNNIDARTNIRTPTLTATTSITAPKVTVSTSPTADTDATNKAYVDSNKIDKTEFEKAGISGYTYTTLYDTFSATTVSEEGYISPHVRITKSGRISKHYKYKITANGSTYELPGELYSKESNALVEYLGNIALFASDTTGFTSPVHNVPFLIFSELEDSGTVDIFTPSPTTITIKVEKIEPTQTVIPTSLIWGDNYCPIKFVKNSGAFNGFSVGENIFKNTRGTIAIGYNNKVSSDFAIAIGNGNTSSGVGSFAIGYNNTSSGQFSHVEGYGNTSSGSISHAEGYGTTANTSYTHAEGYKTTASATYAHAEGNKTIASGGASHAEGQICTASGAISHAGGNYSTTSGRASFAHGNFAKATQPSQFTVGYGNNPQEDSIFEVGNGLDASGNPNNTGSTEPATRQNAFRVTQNGVAIAQTGLQIGSTKMTEPQLQELVENNVLYLHSLKITGTSEYGESAECYCQVYTKTEFTINEVSDLYEVISWEILAYGVMTDIDGMKYMIGLVDTDGEMINFSSYETSGNMKTIAMNAYDTATVEITDHIQRIGV